MLTLDYYWFVWDGWVWHKPCATNVQYNNRGLVNSVDFRGLDNKCNQCGVELSSELVDKVKFLFQYEKV